VPTSWRSILTTFTSFAPGLPAGDDLETRFKDSAYTSALIFSCHVDRQWLALAEIAVELKH
jgi:hypothetical protein